jgi:FAD/FMN-containing dehydrogenase
MAGAQSFGYGAPRGFVIGMRVALSDGRVIKAGGRVVKNVAGYDLCKLFVGSYGTLGLILELTFKLRPRPVRQATLLASGPRAAVWSGARALLSAQLFPVALELLSTQAAAAISAPVAGEDDCALMIRFAGAEASVAFQIEQSRALLDHVPGIKRTETQLADEFLWRSLASLPVRWDDRLIWRIHVPPTELIAILSTENDAGATLFSSDSCWSAGAGDGRLRVLSRLPTEPNAGVELLGKWRARAEEHSGGRLIVESAPRDIKESFAVWGEMGRAGPLMRRVKQQLDPSGTFSPGRFAAGL